MGQKLVYPEEVEVLYMLPAIRRELALYLKQCGLEQKAIARLLRVTEPAISQYLSAKRATSVVFSDKEKEEIRKSGEKLLKNSNLVGETAHLLHMMLDSRATCKICMEVTDAPAGCIACFQHRAHA